MAVDVATLGIEVQTRGVNQANAQLKELEAGGKRADNAINGLATQFKGLGAAISGAALIAATRQVLQVADEMTTLESRLKLVTKSSAELQAVQSRLFAQSQSSQTSFSANADMYIRMAQATGDLGISQERLLALSDGVGKALAVSGASAQSASGALLQMSQAFSGGVLRAEEFNSMIEGAPRLVKALADGLGKNTGELRAMVNAGEVTTDKMLPALENGLLAVNAEFSQLAPTISRSTTALGNAFDKLVSDANKANGATAAVAAGIKFLADNLDFAVGIIGVAAAGALSRYVASLATSTAATIADVIAKNKAIQAEIVLQQSLARTAAAQGAAALSAHAVAAARTAEAAATAKAAAAQASLVTSAGLASRAIGFLGGPIGALVTILGTAAAAWLTFGKSAEDSSAQAVSAIDSALSRAKQLKQEMKFGAGDTGTLNAGLDEIDTQRAAQTARLNSLSDASTRAAANRRKIVTAEVAAALKDLDEKRAKIEEALNDINSGELEAGSNLSGIGAAFKRFMDSTGEYATNAEQDVEKFNKISRAYVSAIEEIKKAKPNEDPLGTTEGQAALERYKTLLGEVQQEILKTAIAAEGKLKDALVESMREGSAEAKKLKEEIADLLREAGNIRSGISGAGAKAQERRDAGLSDTERESVNRRRANDALSSAQTASTYAQNAALDGRAEKAQAYAKQAAELIKQASTYADKIQDNDVAANIFDRIANAEAGALEAQAKVKQNELAEIESRTAAQAQELTNLEARVSALKGEAATVTVDADTAAALAGLTEVQKAVDALPVKKVIEIVWSTTGGAPVAPDGESVSIPARAYGGILPGEYKGDRADNMIYAGTPGEYVTQVPAVRYYGRDFMDAINHMRLPRYAFGGMLGAPSVPSSSAASIPQGNDRVPSNLVIPGVGTFPIETSADVEAAMAKTLRMATLRRGGRRNG